MDHLEADRLELHRLAGDINEFKVTKSTIHMELTRLKSKARVVDAERIKRILEFKKKVSTSQHLGMADLLRAIRARLPREIRDMIYERICISQGSVVVNARRSVFGFREPYGTVYPEHDLLSPIHMGAEFSAEIQNIYWSMNIFEIKIRACQGPFDEELRQLIVIPHAIFQPYQAIRHLRLHVDGRIPFQDARGSIVWDLLETDFTIGEFIMIQMDSRLRALLHLKERDNVCVEFIIQTQFLSTYGQAHRYGLEDERQFMNTLEVLRRYFYELKHAGNTVTVQVQNTPNNRAGRPELKTWDFTPYLWLSASGWEVESHQTDWESELGVGIHYTPRAVIKEDPAAFRDALWQRWRLRHALPWLGEGWGDAV